MQRPQAKMVNQNTEAFIATYTQDKKKLSFHLTKFQVIGVILSFTLRCCLLSFMHVQLMNTIQYLYARFRATASKGDAS